MNRFRISVSEIKTLTPETAGRLTAHNLALPAGGIRRPHPRLIIGGRGCGSAWSLCAMDRPEKLQVFRIQIQKQKQFQLLLKTEKIFEKQEFTFSSRRVPRQWLRRGANVHRSFQRVSGGFIQQQEGQISILTKKSTDENLDRKLCV